MEAGGGLSLSSSMPTRMASCRVGFASVAGAWSTIDMSCSLRGLGVLGRRRGRGLLVVGQVQVGDRADADVGRGEEVLERVGDGQGGVDLCFGEQAQRCLAVLV